MRNEIKNAAKSVGIMVLSVAGTIAVVQNDLHFDSRALYIGCDTMTSVEFDLGNYHPKSCGIALGNVGHFVTVSG